MRSDVLRLYSGFFEKLYVRLRFLICPFESVESHIPKNGKIADVGCGTGLFAFYLALSSKSREIYGIDLNKKRIERALELKDGVGNVHFEAGDVRSAHLPKCDAFTMVDLLHHLPFSAQEKLIRQVFDLLPSGGVFVVKDLGARPVWKAWWNAFHDFVMTREKVYVRRIDDLKSVLESVGFSVELVDLRKWFIPYNHVLFVAKK
jgi:SAM-dependent methyltransferase